jgi:hypothetical protein
MQIIPAWDYPNGEFTGKLEETFLATAVYLND